MGKQAVSSGPHASLSSPLESGSTYRQRQQRDVLVPSIDEVNDLDSSFSRSFEKNQRVSIAHPFCRFGTSDSRIAFLGIDQVRDFKVQGQIGLVILGIASISCVIIFVRDYHCQCERSMLLG